MTELEDVFGEDFASHVQERTAERRQERNRVTDEQKAEIAHLCVNEGKFEEGDPQFNYTTDNGITHTVMLAQVPDPENSEVWEHLSEPWEGAAKLPLEYLGQWYWSVFPDKQDVADLEQGEDLVVVGSIEESEGDNGEVYYNIYPVRGVLQLDDLQQLADAYTGDNDFEQTEEETDTTEDDASEDSSSDGLAFDSDSSSSDSTGLDGLMEDGDEETEEDEEEEEVVPYEDIAHTVEELSDDQDEDEEPQVFEIERDTPELERVTEVVCTKLGIENNEAAEEIVIDVIEEHREDEDDDEDEETTQLF